MECLDYDLMFCWFVGLCMDDLVWNYLVFFKNWDWLLVYDIDELFFDVIKKQVKVKQLMLCEYFSVDGMLLDVCVLMKLFKLKDGLWDNDDENFYGQKCMNIIYVFMIDLDVWLFCKGKGKELKLCYMGYLLMENCNGLIVGIEVIEVGMCQEWEVGLDLLVVQVMYLG